MTVLQEHFRENGISRPTQIIALGKKNNPSKIPEP